MTGYKQLESGEKRMHEMGKKLAKLTPAPVTRLPAGSWSRGEKQKSTSRGKSSSSREEADITTGSISPQASGASSPVLVLARPDSSDAQRGLSVLPFLCDSQGIPGNTCGKSEDQRLRSTTVQAAVGRAEAVTWMPCFPYLGGLEQISLTDN